MAYCARVSNPKNQHNFDTATKLLTYCANNGHWSVFEQVDITMELQVPRDIGRQILRHSANFQEFSQRYAHVSNFCARELRLQDDKNRQNSLPVDDAALHEEWDTDVQKLVDYIKQLQHKWVIRGAAKEVLRTLLPEGLVMSTMYMKNTVRNWAHYCNLRTGNGTQKEHRLLAQMISDRINEHVPEVWEALRRE